MRHYISNCCGAPITETYLPKYAADTESIQFIEWPDTDICSKCKEHSSPETSLFDLSKGDYFTWEDKDYIFNKMIRKRVPMRGVVSIAVVNKMDDNKEQWFQYNHAVDLITL